MIKPHPMLLDIGKLLEECRDRLRYREQEMTEAEVKWLLAYMKGIEHAAKVAAIHLSTETLIQ